MCAYPADYKIQARQYHDREVAMAAAEWREEG